MRKKNLIKVYLTEQQKKIIQAQAESCGSSASEYLATLGMGSQPRQRMTPKEIEALAEVLKARADVINFVNALRGASDEVRRRLFHDQVFMSQWYSYVNNLMSRLDQFIRDFKSPAKD